jgi:hypothetical protein
MVAYHHLSWFKEAAASLNAINNVCVTSVCVKVINGGQCATEILSRAFKLNV